MANCRLLVPWSKIIIRRLSQKHVGSATWLTPSTRHKRKVHLYYRDTKVLLKANEQGTSSARKSVSLSQCLLFLPICPFVSTHLSECLSYKYITSLIQKDHSTWANPSVSPAWSWLLFLPYEFCCQLSQLILKLLSGFCHE